ncbi:hypothetical protein BDZ94DRAFT_1257060, partial [Collybia nuda]
MTRITPLDRPTGVRLGHGTEILVGKRSAPELREFFVVLTPVPMSQWVARSRGAARCAPPWKTAENLQCVSLSRLRDERPSLGFTVIASFVFRVSRGHDQRWWLPNYNTSGNL